MSDNHEEGHSRGTAQSGLRRLMLKLPALRQQLSVMAYSSAWPMSRELFEAYDEACIALDFFRRGEGNEALIEEYEATCVALEADIVRVTEEFE